MWATISGCSAHQRVRCSVHSRARRNSKTPLAERDRVAVHDPRGTRRELTGDDGDHRLVHQPQAVLDAAEADEGVPLLVDCEGEEIPVTEARRDRGRLRRRIVRRFGVAFGDVLEHRRDDEITALDAVGLLDEQTLRAAEPAARRSDGAVRHEVEPDPERAPHRTRRLACLEVSPDVRARERSGTRRRGRACRQRRRGARDHPRPAARRRRLRRAPRGRRSRRVDRRGRARPRPWHGPCPEYAPLGDIPRDSSNGGTCLPFARPHVRLPGASALRGRVRRETFIRGET